MTWGFNLAVKGKL